MMRILNLALKVLKQNFKVFVTFFILISSCVSSNSDYFKESMHYVKFSGRKVYIKICWLLLQCPVCWKLQFRRLQERQWRDNAQHVGNTFDWIVESSGNLCHQSQIFPKPERLRPVVVSRKRGCMQSFTRSAWKFHHQGHLDVSSRDQLPLRLPHKERLLLCL